jgi:two-component system, OmpR family, response regulator
LIANTQQVAPLTLLLVEDDASVRNSLADYLAKADLRVTATCDAKAARTALQARMFDLVLLDIMMPGEDGLSLCRYIRERLDLPIILLTARTEDADRIIGLEMGADDYMAKPFNPRELLARIKVVVRRSRALPPSMRIANRERISFGTWTLNLSERELVDENGVAVPLSTGEFTLLRVFVERPRRVLTREQLLELTRGASNIDSFDRSIDNQVSRLRKKIERNPAAPQLIKTVRGGGYVFSGEVRR